MTTYLREAGMNLFAHEKSWGVSPDAGRVRAETDKVKQSFARTVSYGDHLSELLESLFKLRREYSKDDWDGYGAKALSESSCENALDLALSLSADGPAPELDVLPSGQVSFTWQRDKRRVFTVVAGDRNEYSYAGLFGASTTYGVEYSGDRILGKISESIKRINS